MTSQFAWEPDTDRWRWDGVEGALSPDKFLVYSVADNHGNVTRRESLLQPGEAPEPPTCEELLAEASAEIDRLKAEIEILKSQQRGPNH